MQAGGGGGGKLPCPWAGIHSSTGQLCFRGHGQYLGCQSGCSQRFGPQGEAPRGSQWPHPSLSVLWVRSTTMVSIQPCPALGDSGAGSLHALRPCTAHLWLEGAASAGSVLGLIRVAAFFHLGGAHGHRAPLGPSLPEGGGGAPPPAPASGSLPACVPRSVLEILNLIHQRELRLADGHIMELEAECAQGGSGASGKDGSRKAKDVALLYEALQEALWAVLAEALAAKSAYPPLEQLVQVIEQEEEADRSWRQAQGGSAGSPGPRQMRQRWAEAVDRLAGQKLCQCVEGRAGTIATRMDRLAKCTVEDLSSVKRHLLQVYPEEYQAFGVYLGSYHRGLARCLAEGVRKQLSLSELYFVLDWNSNIYQRWAVRAPWSGGGRQRLGEGLGSLQDCPPSTDPPGAQVGMPAGSWHIVWGGRVRGAPQKRGWPR